MTVYHCDNPFQVDDQRASDRARDHARLKHQRDVSRNELCAGRTLRQRALDRWWRYTFREFNWYRYFSFSSITALFGLFFFLSFEESPRELDCFFHVSDSKSWNLSHICDQVQPLGLENIGPTTQLRVPRFLRRRPRIAAAGHGAAANVSLGENPAIPESDTAIGVER